MIKIYGSDHCSYCTRAKVLAKNYNLEYTYINKDDNIFEFSELFPDAKTVPQITWDGRYIGGYEEFAEEVTNTIGGYGDGAF